MIKKTNIIIISLLIINLICTGIIGYSYFTNDNEGIFTTISDNTDSLNFANGAKYTLYIGTNDKDTKEPMSTDEARSIVNSICDKYVSGYSTFNSQGYWTNNLNQSEHEESLVYTFYNVTDNQIKSILNETIKELNQESILVEKENAYYTYYGT